ncbi:anti-sigma factor [Lysobacter sp. CFH 32150]|uniref:anti-sigma factor n=1 Tax=Lysobacter sp. CFH 32150 TaxID=2927128 RepID=UPI001FA725DC|nr:anti-sigma factor [Lysobacter sp. CFH 32150]MCI4568970.1 anti-sigma factor [Lysobacter sp. CFH 32150]
MNIRDPQFDEDSGHEPPSADVQAAEYVLGVLDATQRRQVEARIAATPAFARLVDAWEQRLGALLDAIEPMAAPAHVWPRIRTRLGWSPVEGSSRGAWQSVTFWRATTALAAAIAVAAVFLGRVPQAPAPVTPPVVMQPSEPAQPVTTLARDDGTPGWLASIDVVRGIVRIVPVPAPADAQGRVPELWVIPPGEAPRSLGLVSVDKTQLVVVPQALLRALAKGSTLAISLEPPGGAPQGVPTGPIIAKGGIQAI